MASNKKYWKSVEELNENSSIVERLRIKTLCLLHQQLVETF